MNENFPWDDLLDYVEDGKVVPVIGHELVRAEYQGRHVSLQRILAERLAEREKLSVEWTSHFELNDAVCAYLANPQARLGGLYDRIAGLLRSLSPPFPVPEALTKLASLPTLDLFVSLTFDSLLARALEGARGGKANEIEFSLNQSTAAQAAAHKVQSGDGPVVFNLFGRATGRSDFAIHDEDALEFIHRFVSGDVAPPDWLLSELRNRHLLILGVHLPDWLERFLLRAATRDRLRLAQKAYFIAGENVSSATFTQFLHRFGRETSISAYEGPAGAFVDELSRRWIERHPAVAANDNGDAAGAANGNGNGHGIRPQDARSIFISYGRENLAAVERLHRAIVSLGGDAWFDQADLAAGDQWEKKILPQIRRDVRLFIPVISDNTAQRKEGYVFREWREALERSKSIVGRRFIVPIVVDDGYNGDVRRYQALMDEFPDFQALNIGRAPSGDPDETLRKTLIAEIRNMRREEEAP